jgi:serine phosphatase RsbU (regulator of sigma subunit)
VSDRDAILVMEGGCAEGGALRDAFGDPQEKVTWTPSSHSALSAQGDFGRLKLAVLASDNSDDRAALRRLVRKLAQFRVPVLVIDAHADAAQRCELLECGAEAVVAAAPSAGELRLLAENALRMRRELDFLTAENNRIQLLDAAIQQRYGQLAQELRLAHKLQVDFLPKRLPQFDHVRFACLFRPANWVSGDLYDVQRLDEKHVGLYVADAVGHGMPAALLTMFVRRCIVFKRISGNRYRLVRPAEILTALNADLVEVGLDGEQFVTALCMVINVEDLSIEYASGGHAGPLRMDRNGRIDRLPADGPLLGVFETVEFESFKLQLHPGERLVLYSDGAEHAISLDAGDAQERFFAELAARAKLDPHRMLEDFAAHFCPEDATPATLPDDVTLLAIDAADRSA